MVKIPHFEVERWMDEYEVTATYNLAETCCASISIDDLLGLDGTGHREVFDYSKKLTYGSIPGSDELRRNIAALYPLADGSALSPENVVVAPGAIQANFQVSYTLAGPGDHVICQFPTYQQLYQVPLSVGAEVSLWKSKESEGWSVDIAELKSMIRPNTKLIVINNPQNPTGAVLSTEDLLQIIDIAREQDIFVHADEVYRPLFHDAATSNIPKSILSFGYDKAISTSSMSKAYSLAGIRIGWVCSKDRDFVERVASVRDYTTISVSQLDDRVAALALEPSTRRLLIQRNLSLAKRNLEALHNFIKEFSWACRWVSPRGGTTAMVQFRNKGGGIVDDVVFCKRLQERKGVMLLPASKCFGHGDDYHGYVRFGFVPEHNVLVAGLDALRAFLHSEDYSSLPLVQFS